MMPGVSYYVLVDKDGNVLEETDMITTYAFLYANFLYGQ